MSEPDSTPRRRPPTIDLTAKEIEAEATASPQNAAASDGANDRSAAAHASGERGGGFHARPYAIGVVLGAVAAGAVIAGIWAAGLVPARENVAPSAPAAKIVAADGVSSRRDEISQVVQTPQPDEALAARVTAAEAQTKSLGGTVAALSRRVDEIGTTSQRALEQAKASAAAAQEAKNAAQAGIQHSDIEALANRIAALETALKSLTADVAQHRSNADDSAARAVIAAEALRAAIERGAPFQAELAAAKSLGADQAAAAKLEPFAANGIPSAAALGRELSALMPALRRASEPEQNSSSLLGRLESRARQLVRITPLHTGAAPPPLAPAGDDAATAIAALNAAAARGDIAAALSDVAHLPDAARALAATWVNKAQAREQALAASQRIAADALAALAKPVTQ